VDIPPPLDVKNKSLGRPNTTLASPFLASTNAVWVVIAANMSKARSLVEEDRERLKWEEDEWELEEFGKNECDDDSEPDESYDSLSRVK